MATRAKYTRVRAPEENKDDKLDTDILMKFSPRYGIQLSTQASMFPGLSLSSLVKARALSPSRLQSASWIKLYGSQKSFAGKSKAFTKSLISPNAKLLMSGNPVKKDSSQLEKNVSSPSSKSP